MSSNLPTNTASTFVAQSLEDAVKAGLGATSLDGAALVTGLFHNPITVILAFAGGFIASLILSFLSQPFGNKATNHIFGQAEEYTQELVQGILNQLGNVPAQVRAPAPVLDHPDSITVPLVPQSAPLN